MSNEYSAAEKMHKKASTAMVFTGIKEGNGVFKASHADMIAAHAQVTQDIAVRFADYASGFQKWPDGLWRSTSEFFRIKGSHSNMPEPSGATPFTTQELYTEFLKTL